MDNLANLLDFEPPHLHARSEETSEKEIESESRSRGSPSGGLLCTTLMEVYEGSKVKLMRQKGCGTGVGLVSKALCLLLASSQTAKQTALKGMLRMCPY